MKILFVTDLFPIANNNEPKTLSYFVNNWKQFGHDIDVIRPNFLLNSFLRNKKILKEGVFHENDVRILNLNFITPFWFNVKNKLPECFNVDDYDVVVSHMPSGALFANKLIKKSKIPFVCSVHASDIEVLTKPLYKFYFASKLKKAYKRADLLSPRSYVLEKKITSILKYKKQKPIVAYSGIEDEFIEPVGLSLEKIDDLNRHRVLRIVTVASLIKRKNIDVVLKALSKLDDVNWNYTVIGAGKELYNLVQLAKKLKISDKVTFLLQLPRDKVLEKLKKSNIFVMVSEKETFGMAYLEAMAAGNLVVARRNDGIDGIIKHEENGFLVGSEEELVATLNKISRMDYSKIKQLYLNSNTTIHSYTDSTAGKNYIDNIQKLVESKKIKDEKPL